MTAFDMNTLTAQPAFTSSKSPLETPKQCVKSAQSSQ